MRLINHFMPGYCLCFSEEVEVVSPLTAFFSLMYETEVKLCKTFNQSV